MTPVAFLANQKNPNQKLFESWHRQGFAGIALYVMSPQEVEQLNSWPNSAFQYINQHSQIVSINAVPSALTKLGPFLSRLDQCAVLISHLGLPGRFTKALSRLETRKVLQPLRSLAKLPQVGVKLSGLYAISEPSHAYPHESSHPFVSELFDTFGPQRLYWGSDFSPALEHVSFAQTIDVLFQFRWSESDLQNIMHDNLMRVIRRSRTGGNPKSECRISKET